MKAKEKILFVDDEVNILNAFKRRLRSEYNFETCSNSLEALDLIKNNKDFAVVISDMTMPELNGVELLNKVSKISPNTVRVMLTGNADQQTATLAVNNAGVFRFVNKPCSVEEISVVINSALEQYKLITAEKELLQNTLSGSVKLLTDLLALLNPSSFGAALNYRELVKQIGVKLELGNVWDIELALMLSDIGAFMVPDTLLRKSENGVELNEAEQKVIDQIPETGRKLISNIPRLEKVANAVFYSQKNYDGSGFPSDSVKGEEIPIGARIIRILKDYARYLPSRKSSALVFDLLESKPSVYDPTLLAVIKGLFICEQKPEEELPVYEVTIKQLCPGQIVLEDILTNDGVLLVKQGTEISTTMIQRIVNYGEISGIKMPILVNSLMPTD